MSSTDLAHDQAEGLRQIFAKAVNSRMVTVMSTLKAQKKDSMMVNLVAAVAGRGSDVLLVDGRIGDNGIVSHFGRSTAMTLDDTIAKDIPPEKALLHAREGFNMMRLFSGDAIKDQKKLELAFETLLRHTQFILIDGEPNLKGELPLRAMEEGNLLLQLAANANSITSAYSLIKRLHVHTGRRRFDIVVTGSNENSAVTASTNLATTAKRHLAVSLNYIGSIPEDPLIEKAASLGKAVTDAFPMSGASVAYVRIADSLLKR